MGPQDEYAKRPQKKHKHKDGEQRGPQRVKLKHAIFVHEQQSFQSPYRGADFAHCNNNAIPIIVALRGEPQLRSVTPLPDSGEPL
eukprot:4970813-Amphidinium_carterae.2